MRRDFSGGSLVENLPCSAGYVSPIPGAGTKISHAAGQLSLCTAVTEPVCSRASLLQLLSPRSTTRESTQPKKSILQPHLGRESCQKSHPIVTSQGTVPTMPNLRAQFAWPSIYHESRSYLHKNLPGDMSGNPDWVDWWRAVSAKANL